MELYLGSSAGAPVQPVEPSGCLHLNRSSSGRAATHVSVLCLSRRVAGGRLSHGGVFDLTYPSLDDIWEQRWRECVGSPGPRHIFQAFVKTVITAIFDTKDRQTHAHTRARAFKSLRATKAKVGVIFTPPPPTRLSLYKSA